MSERAPGAFGSSDRANRENAQEHRTPNYWTRSITNAEPEIPDNRSRSRTPPKARPPPWAPPSELLAERGNAVNFSINAIVDPMGPIDEILKQLGLQLISKASTGNFTADAEDQHTATVHDVKNGVFIGGSVIQLTPEEYSEAILTNHVSVFLPS